MSPSESIVQSKEELLRRINAAHGNIAIIGATAYAEIERCIIDAAEAKGATIIMVVDSVMSETGLVSPTGRYAGHMALSPPALDFRLRESPVFPEEPFIPKHNHKRLKFQGADEGIVSGDMKMKQELKNKKRKDRKRKNNHKRKQR